MSWIKDIYDISKDIFLKIKRNKESKKIVIHKPSDAEFNQFVVEPFKNKIEEKTTELHGEFSGIAWYYIILLVLSIIKRNIPEKWQNVLPYISLNNLFLTAILILILIMIFKVLKRRLRKINK